jgi:ABC-type glycerol-3-phosphate transport system substrate-binding protein
LRADLINMPPSYACGYTARLTPIPDGTITAAQARETFLAAALDGVTCGGTLVGLPREYNLEYGGILVNMKRYKAKLPDRSPADWKSWDDVLKDAKDLTEYDADGNVQVAGLELRHRDPLKHMYLALILQQGGTFWNADRTGFTFNTPQGRAALQWLGDLARVHKVLNVDDPPPSRWAVALLEVVEERGAMVYIGTWGHAVTLELARMQNREVQLEYFAHPPFFGQDHVFVQNSGWSLVVPRNSTNAAVALDVARFMTTDPAAVIEWNRLAGSISPLRVHATPAALASDPIKSPIQPLLDLGKWVGYIPPVPLTETRQLWFSHILSVMGGELTPEQAAQKIDDESNQSLGRAR